MTRPEDNWKSDWMTDREAACLRRSKVEGGCLAAGDYYCYDCREECPNDFEKGWLKKELDAAVAEVTFKDRHEKMIEDVNHNLDILAKLTQNATHAHGTVVMSRGDFDRMLAVLGYIRRSVDQFPSSTQTRRMSSKA